MRVPSFVLIAAALLLALPTGWGLGLLMALALAGPNFGQLPALTVPLGIVAAAVFALMPSVSAKARLSIMAAAAGFFVLLGFIVP